LREWSSAAQRADIIVVSKCPSVLTEGDKQQMIKELAPLSYQKIFFSYYSYQKPYYIFNPIYRAPLNPDLNILLISAIARTAYLVDYLEEEVDSVRVLQYEDHHYFTNYDVSHLKRNFELIENPNKIILTTEKDAMRLELHKAHFIEKNIRIYAIPVEVQFHFEEGKKFDQEIVDYLLSFKA